jgi:hypothetical protein
MIKTMLDARVVKKNLEKSEVRVWETKERSTKFSSVQEASRELLHSAASAR